MSNVIRGRRGKLLAMASASALVGTVCLAAPSPSAAVAAPPDLVVSKVSDPPANAEPGRTFVTSVTVKNVGGAKAGPSTTRFYLSRDRSRGASDLRLAASDRVGALPGGRAEAGSTSLVIPASTPTGSYYVIACADDARTVRESKEANNCRASVGRVTVGRPFKGLLTGTLTFTDEGDETDDGTRETWDRGVEVRIRMVVHGARPGFETFADDGSSYGLVGVRHTSNQEPGCLNTSQTDESGAGGYLYTGDPFTDDIYGHFGHVDRSQVHVGLFSTYETTTTYTQTGSGEFPCEDHQQVEGPDDAVDVTAIDFVEVSRTSGSITYRADAWEGPFGATSEWDDIAGRLVLAEVR